MNFSAIYAIGVGVLMLVQWVFFLVTGNVPELQSAPWSITFHLAAEFLTAILLITSGVMLIKVHPLAKQVFLLAAGMVIYAMVNSAGYFAQAGDWIFVVIFGVLLALAGISVYRALVPKMSSKTG